MRPLHAPDFRAGAPVDAGSPTHTDRPARLSRSDAKRLASELVDDVLRGGERAAAGWIARGDMPHVAARCRTDRHIEFVTEGDHVVVRCAP